ncbi:hypothetical protein GGR21_002385 [Dysgonomonas hofstadii]|uniref:Uncharacterized protein n=1 Tax=Dysgonomonas hofstadii TaxID=637886 RepID=A0A840CX78_9BACT|nr:hypothetical protein [Dysgonomonas hofstadii]
MYIGAKVIILLISSKDGFATVRQTQGNSKLQAVNYNELTAYRETKRGATLHRSSSLTIIKE